MNANIDTAAECMRQVPLLKRKVNTQDPCIMNARVAIIIYNVNAKTCL